MPSTISSENNELLFDVYICHAYEDKIKADAVCHYLEAHDIRCFYPLRNRDVNTTEILQKSQILVLVYSRLTFSSYEVQNVLILANQYNMKIVSIRIDETPASQTIPINLVDCHWIDAMTESFEKALTDLIVHITTVLSLDVPIADFTIPSGKIKTNKKVLFSNSSVNAKKYRWDFGDEQFSNDKDGVHIFNSAGQYNVKLSAINGNKIDCCEKTIRVTNHRYLVLSVCIAVLIICLSAVAFIGMSQLNENYDEIPAKFLQSVPASLTQKPLVNNIADGSLSNPYVITNQNELNLIRDNPAAHYILGNNIDIETGTNWEPINLFSGSLDGNGYSIKNLCIDANDNAGLFGITDSGCHIKNLILENISVSGDNNVGALAGTLGKDSVVHSCFVTGTINGDKYVGGLFGSIKENCTLNTCIFTGEIYGESWCGGLTGISKDSTILFCYSEANITAEYKIGGLAGYASSTQIYASGSTGNIITPLDSGGGLIGDDYRSKIYSCWSSCNLNGINNVGGLIGFAKETVIIACYSTGNVKGDENIGGIIGSANTPSIHQCYASGAVSGNTAIGGLIGYLTGGGRIIKTAAINKEINGNEKINTIIGHLLELASNSERVTNLCSECYYWNNLQNQLLGNKYGYSGTSLPENEIWNCFPNGAWKGWDTTIWASNSTNAEDQLPTLKCQEDLKSSTIIKQTLTQNIMVI